MHPYRLLYQTMKEISTNILCRAIDTTLLATDNRHAWACCEKQFQVHPHNLYYPLSNTTTLSHTVNTYIILIPRSPTESIGAIPPLQSLLLGKATPVCTNGNPCDESASRSTAIADYSKPPNLVGQGGCASQNVKHLDRF
jgi:hypothetical protein